jgi:hypothetical protein
VPLGVVLMTIPVTILGLPRCGGKNKSGGGQCCENLLFHDVSLSIAQFIMKAFWNISPEPKLRR